MFKYQGCEPDKVYINDLEYQSKVAACLYVAHHFGTSVYDTIRQGCEPDIDSNQWPKIGGQPTAIHCGHMGPAPACPLYLDSKERFFKLARISKVTRDLNTNYEQLKKTTDEKESKQQRMVELIKMKKQNDEELSSFERFELRLKIDQFVWYFERVCLELVRLDSKRQELDVKLKELKIELEELGLSHLLGQINVRGERTPTHIPMYKGEEEPEKPEKWSRRKVCEHAELCRCRLPCIHVGNDESIVYQMSLPKLAF